MKNLELNPEFNLLGQIDLNSVKIALDRDEMEEIVGGYSPGCGTVGFMYIPAYMLGSVFSYYWHSLAKICLAN